MYNNSVPQNNSNQRVISGQSFVTAFWDREKAAVQSQGGCSSVATVQPVNYQPWTAAPQWGHAAPVMDMSYPSMMDKSSLVVGGNQQVNQAGMMGGSCGSNMNIDNLMPGSWRNPMANSMAGASNGGSCMSENAAQSLWSKYSPSARSFSNAITAAGSARLSLNTRSALTRNIGLPNLLRQGPAVPVSSQAVLFGDSSFRADSIANATGAYPTLSECSM